METRETEAETQRRPNWLPGSLLLGIDTCGPAGSVAVGRLKDGKVEILAQTHLEGKSYSATLVAAVAELLKNAGWQLRELHAIVAVNGPGSFTGVRVGLSAVKGLAEAAKISVLAVSRLEVLAWKAGVSGDRSSLLGCKAGVGSAALDAHRGEVFLGIDDDRGGYRELLAGPTDLGGIAFAGGRVAVCDDTSAEILTAAWPEAEQVRVEAPTAADALRLCAARVTAGDFVDLALLDGHYLRKSDAEIFGKMPESRPV